MSDTIHSCHDQCQRPMCVLRRERDEARSDLEFRRDLFQLQEKQLNEVRAERDDWKARYIQQNKDLGYEMRDPNLTIWGHAKKLQDENKALQEQLDAAIMLGKMQERRHERELAEARGESFQVQAWKKLIEEHRNEMRGL